MENVQPLLVALVQIMQVSLNTLMTQKVPVKFPFCAIIIFLQYFVCLVGGSNAIIEGVITPRVFHFGDNLDMTITLLDNPIRLSIHDCFILEFFEADISLFRTSCLKLDEHIVPASCRAFNEYDQCKQVTFGFYWHQHYLKNAQMNPSVIDVQISMPNVDIQWLLNSRIYIVPRFQGITSPLSSKTVGDGYLALADCDQDTRFCNLTGKIELEAHESDPNFCSDMSRAHDIDLNITMQCMWSEAISIQEGAQVLTSERIRVPHNRIIRNAVACKNNKLTCAFDSLVGWTSLYHLHIYVTYSNASTNVMIPEKRGIYGVNSIDFELQTHKDSFRTSGYVPVQFASNIYVDEILHTSVNTYKKTLLYSLFFPEYIEWTLTIARYQEAWVDPRDYTLNGKMIIEREYQGNSIASVSIDIRSPAVDIANKLMEAFALDSVGVIVRQSSATRIIISVRVLRSVGNLVLKTDKIFPTPSTAILEPSILCKFDDIAVVPDIIMSEFVICEAPAIFSIAGTRNVSFSYDYGRTWLPSSVQISYLPIVTKLSLDQASPRGNEVLVVYADGLQPGCKCIYGPTFGWAESQESILHQDYLSLRCIIPAVPHPIHRDIAQAVHITCGSHVNVENYHLIFENKSLPSYFLNKYFGVNEYITTPLGFSNPNEPANIFFYQVLPTINYIYPQSGPNDGNTVVHIHGKYFKNDKNIQCIFVQPGFFRIMIVKPLVLDEEHITCKTPTVNLVCNYVNYSSTEASVFDCSSESGCYCEKDKFAYVKVHVITNYAPQIRQWQKYASNALQFLYYRSKFAITGAGPKMSYAKFMQGKMQKELPIYISSQASGGFEILLTGFGFRPEMRRIEPIVLKPKRVDGPELQRFERQVFTRPEIELQKRNDKVVIGMVNNDRYLVAYTDRSKTSIMLSLLDHRLEPMYLAPDHSKIGPIYGTTPQLGPIHGMNIMGIKGGAVLVWEQYIGNYRNREHWAVFAQVFDQFGNRKMRMDKVLSNQLPCQAEQSYGTFEVTNCFHRDGPCNNVSYILTNDCPYSSPGPIVNYIEEGFSITWKQYNHKTRGVDFMLEIYRHSYIPLSLYKNGYIFALEAEYMTVTLSIEKKTWNEVLATFSFVTTYGNTYQAEVVNERGETVLLSNGDLILLTNEVNAVDNGIYTFDTTCAVAAACDHLRSDSRLMRGVRHYTYGEIFADSQTIGLQSVNGNMYTKCAKDQNNEPIEGQCQKMNGQFIGITIAAEYTDGYRIESFDKHANYVNQFWSAYEKQTFRRSLVEQSVCSGAADDNPCLNPVIENYGSDTNPYRQGACFPLRDPEDRLIMQEKFYEDPPLGSEAFPFRFAAKLIYSQPVVFFGCPGSTCSVSDEQGYRDHCSSFTDLELCVPPCAVHGEVCSTTLLDNPKGSCESLTYLECSSNRFCSQSLPSNNDIESVDEELANKFLQLYETSYPSNQTCLSLGFTSDGTTPEDNLKCRIKSTKQYKDKRELYYKCSHKYHDQTLGTRCVHVVNRRLSGGYVLEKDAEDPITVGTDMQEWKILGSNSLINNEHIDCSDYTKYSCRNPLKSMDYHVGGTPYIIQKQLVPVFGISGNAVSSSNIISSSLFVTGQVEYTSPETESISFASLSDGKKNGTTIYFYANSSHLNLLSFKVDSRVRSANRVYKHGSHLENCTSRLFVSMSPRKEGYVVVYVTGNSTLNIRKGLWTGIGNKYLGKAERIVLKNYRNVQIQFVAVLGNSYVVSLLLTDKRISNSSKLHMLRFNDIFERPQVVKVLPRHSYMETHKIPNSNISMVNPYLSVYQSDYNIFDGTSAAVSDMIYGSITLVRWVRENNEDKVWISRLQDSLVKCRFGSTISAFATYVSEEEVRCILPGSPTPPEGDAEEVAEISLTFNGIDYSPTNVFIRYYPNCPVGTYGADDIDPLREARCRPCPAGHFCKREGQYRAEKCLPGSFANQEQQSECTPCPLGYFCPSFGMSEPMLCTAGYVCDSVGTVMPITPCPQGHYCLPGTATTLGDCCATGPALGHAAAVSPGLPKSIDDMRKAILAWNDTSAMRYVDRYPALGSPADEYKFPLPKWLPPLEAGQKKEGTYTCGTGPETLGKPCCSCYSRPRGTDAERCTPRMAVYRGTQSQNSLDSQVWCAKLYTESIVDALDGKANYNFVKQSDIDTGPYNANNCEYIFGAGINLQDAQKICQDHESNVYCKFNSQSRKVSGYYELTNEGTLAVASEYVKIQSNPKVWKSLDHGYNPRDNPAKFKGLVTSPLDINAPRFAEGDVIQYNEDKTMFTCASDHQGDKHLKQEGDMFFAHVPLKSAFTNASDNSNSNVTTYFLHFRTKVPHQIYFEDRVEFNHVFLTEGTGEPVEQVDLTVLNVLDPYNFITNTRTGMVLSDEINPLNKLEATIRFTRAAVYDSKSLPEEGKGKRPSLFPEGFWREVWIPVPGVHRIELADLEHVRNEFNGIDYRRHVKRGWEIQLIDENTGFTQVFVVASSGLFSANAFRLEKKSDNKELWSSWWTNQESPAVTKEMTRAKMYKKYPGVADRTKAIIGRPLICSSGMYCGTGVGIFESLPCTDANKIDGKCNLTPQPCAQGYNCASGAKVPQGDNQCIRTKFCASAVEYSLSGAWTLRESRQICKIVETITIGNTTKSEMIDGALRTSFLGVEPGFVGTPCNCDDTQICVISDIALSEVATLSCQPAHLDFFYCNCILGHSCPSIGMREPTACSAGTYNDVNNALTCKPCLTGFMCPDSATVFPKACPAGFICDTLGLVREQTLCSAGFVCLWGVRTVLPRHSDDFIPCTKQQPRERLGRNSLSAGESVTCNYTKALNPRVLFDMVYNGDIQQQKTIKATYMSTHNMSGLRAYANLLDEGYLQRMIDEGTPSSEFNRIYNPHYIRNMYNVVPGCKKHGTVDYCTGPAEKCHTNATQVSEESCISVGICIGLNANCSSQLTSGTCVSFNSTCSWAPCVWVPRPESHCPEDFEKNNFNGILNEQILWLDVQMNTLSYIYDSIEKLSFSYSHAMVNGLLYYVKTRLYVTNAITYQTLSEIWKIRAPLPCPKGYYCLSGIKDFVPITGTPIADIEIASLVPALCLEGTYCLQGTSTPTGTAKCMKGFRCPTGVHKPVSVVPGKFSLDNAGARGQFCFAGRFTRQSGRWFCSLCPKGFICNLNSGNTPDTSLNFRNDTTICYRGFVCDKKGQAAPPTKCPEGHYCLEGTASSTVATKSSLEPVSFQPGNIFSWVLLPNTSLAVVTCELPVTVDTEMCDITSFLDRGDTIELAGSRFRISSNTSRVFGPNCIMYGNALDITCRDEAQLSRKALEELLIEYPILCKSMLKDCSLVNIHKFAYKTNEWDSIDNDMFWPIQVVPLDRAHPTFTDEKAGKCVDLAGENELSCIQRTINGIMPKHNKKIHAFRIGSPECKTDNTCGVIFAEGKVHADYLLPNPPSMISKLNSDDPSWKDDLIMRRSEGDIIPTLVSPNNDKFRVYGYDDSASTELVICRLQRLWGEPIYKVTSGPEELCKQMEPRKCKNRKIRQPECDSTPHWPYKITNESYLVAQINFTNDMIVDYVKLEIQSNIEVNNEGVSTAYLSGIINASRPRWQYYADNKWEGFDDCGCGNSTYDILHCSCLFENSAKLERILYERKYDHAYFSSQKIIGGMKVYWSTGIDPIMLVLKTGKTYKMKREPGLLYIHFEYSNFLANTTRAEDFTGIEEEQADYEGLYGHEFKISLPPVAIENMTKRDSSYQSLNPQYEAGKETNGAVSYTIKQPVMHIVKKTDFLNQTVYHEDYDMRKLKSIEVRINTELYSVNSDTLAIHLSGIRVFTRKQVYKSGHIQMVKKAISLDDEKHFQQDIFPFAKTEDEIRISNASKSCCAHPIPCLEGSYCLRGVTQPVIDFAGEDFTAPLACLSGHYCPLASETSIGDGACPAGYYCPPGISIPRPCWKGHQCQGIANVLPKACPAGKYSWGGPYAPFAPEVSSGVEDVDYKIYSFLSHLKKSERSKALLGRQFLGSRRCTEFCCPTMDEAGKVLNVSNIEVDREAFGTMPGLTGKCSLSPRCYPLTKANLMNLQDKDLTDYGCQGEQLVRGEYSMGAYDYDWWPDTEIEGATSTSVHWQQLPQPFGLHKHLDQLHEKNVLKKKLQDIRQEFGADYDEIGQSLENRGLEELKKDIDQGGVYTSNLKRFSLESCPHGMIRDCNDACWHKDTCAVPSKGIQNCSSLVGDNICHDGTLPNLPNFDCLRFACDGGDCDSSCLDTLMEKSSHLLQTASCDFWHEEVTNGRKTGANMCGKKVIPDVNVDNDPLNDIEPSLILSCNECGKFHKGPYQYISTAQKPMENFYADLTGETSAEDEEIRLSARYQQTTEIWDEALDGPAEIYFNPPKEWWQVPVTTSKGMMFGCTKENVVAKKPCARFFNLTKQYFQQLGEVDAYTTLAKLIVKMSALESGTWYDYSSTNRIKHNHGGGHPLERTVCAVQSALYEQWFKDTVACAGTKAGMETNVEYDPLQDQDDIVYDYSGTPTDTTPAWKELFNWVDENNRKDATGTPQGHAYYKTLVYIVDKLSQAHIEMGKTASIKDVYDRLVDENNFKAGIPNPELLMPNIMNNTRPYIDYLVEFNKHVLNPRYVPNDARKSEVFLDFLSKGYIDVKSYPKQFFGSKFSRLSGATVTNNGLKQRLFTGSPGSNVGTCGSGRSKLQWDISDFISAVNDLSIAQLSDRIYGTMETCGENGLGTQPKTILAKWPYYPGMQGFSRSTDLSENHKPNVDQDFYLEYDAGRRLSTDVYAQYRVFQRDDSCEKGEGYMCGNTNRDFRTEANILRGWGCQDCCPGELSCYAKARFTISKHRWSKSLQRWINVRTMSNQTRYWMQTSKLSQDFWHTPTDLNKEAEKKTVCRFKLGAKYEPSDCVHRIEIGFHIRFVSDKCSLPLAEAIFKAPRFEPDPPNFWTEGTYADGFHQSSSPCFKVFSTSMITATPGITRAYRFPDAIGAMDSLGKISTTGTNDMREYNARKESVSIEMWIRPDNLHNSTGVLFETGSSSLQKCDCDTLANSLSSFKREECEEGSDLFTQWAMYQLADKGPRKGKMICEAGFALLLDNGRVVLKLNPLFGERHINVSGTLPNPMYSNDFYHIVGVIDRGLPWDKCSDDAYCGSVNSHRYHADLRLTLFINSRFVESTLCPACGAWTSLDAVGLGAAASGGFGFHAGKAYKTSCFDRSGKRSDRCSEDGSTDNPWGNDDTEFEQVPNGGYEKKRRTSYECESCSSPLYINVNKSNINGGWVNSNEKYTGYISILRIYKKALTALSVRQNFNAYTMAGGITKPFPKSCKNTYQDTTMDKISDLETLPYTELVRLDKQKKINLMKISWASCPRQDALYGSDDLLGASECQPCPDGYYCPTEGTIYPIQCPLGSYQAGLNAKSCNNCPVGTWSNKKKLANVFECSPCDSGHVCEIVGNRDMDVFALLPKTNFCPEGHYCMQGTSKATNTEFKCAAGMFCSFGTRPPQDFKKRGMWVARAQEITKDVQTCNEYSNKLVPWDQAAWSVINGIVLPKCMWKYSGDFSFRGIIGHYLYADVLRQMRSVDTTTLGIATKRNKARDQCHPNVIATHGGCLEGVIVNVISPEDRDKGFRPSLFYGREFTHPDLLFACPGSALAGVFPPPEPMSPDQNMMKDRYGKPPGYYNYRQFRWAKCVDNIEDPKDPTLMKIFDGFRRLQNTGDEWYDTTAAQHIRDLKTYFDADFTKNTKLLFRDMPQAMIDYVTGECKRKQVQEAYEIWLGSKRKIIQPKSSLGYALPPRLLQERLAPPEPIDPNGLDNDLKDRGEFIAFEQLWLENKPEDEVYDTTFMKQRKVLKNPANCQRFWSGAFANDEQYVIGEEVFKNIRKLWSDQKAFTPGAPQRECKLVRTGIRHTRVFDVYCPAWHAGGPSDLSSMSVDSEFSKLPSHPKEMFFKELHQFHHETFPYIVQWESGPFYKCPTGYACGQATRSSDNSRLDKNCARGFFCPIGTPGPQPNDILVEKLPGINCYKNRCRRPSPRITAQWKLSLGVGLNHTVISVSFDGIETYEAGKYVNRQYKHILGRICNVYDQAEVKANFEKVFRHALSYFSNEPLKSIDTGFELELDIKPQCSCSKWIKKISQIECPDSCRNTCNKRVCLEWVNCTSSDRLSTLTDEGKIIALQREIQARFTPQPESALYYVTMILGPYSIRCSPQNVKSCHQIEYGGKVNTAGNLKNRLDLSRISFSIETASQEHSLLCQGLFESDATCASLSYQFETFCLRAGCISKNLAHKVRDNLMLCSTRHTLRVKNKNADGSGDYYCDSEKCDARDQSGSILPYKISSFECKFNWETYLCPTGTSSGTNSLSPSDCLIDWSCASKNIPMYKNVFGNVGSATLKVEDDPLPYFCPIRQDDVVLVYEPRFEPGSTEPFARPTNSLKLAMAKIYKVQRIPNDAQIVMGDRWIKGKWGKSPIYDGIQGYKKALHVNRRPQIYINVLRSCHTYADELKRTIQEIPCTRNSSELSDVDIPLIVDDPAFFPMVYVPSFGHATIEFDLLHLPLELKSNVGFTLVFYTKEIGRQRKQHSAVLNPSSFEIKDSDASEHRGLLHFTWNTANATYIQFGAAILNGRFDRYYYYRMFYKTARVYIDFPRRTRDQQPGRLMDQNEANWQFFAVLNRIDTDQAQTKSVLPTNLPMLDQVGAVISFLPQNNSGYCASKFKNASNLSRPILCETDLHGHVSFPVTNEYATVFPSGLSYWRNGLQCKACHYDPLGVLDEGFWGSGGGLENCGKRFINFENPTPEKDQITFNKTRPYRVSHLQISDTSRQMDILYEPFQTFSAFPYVPYFSNCYKHGLRMSIFRLMEDPETCDFVEDRMATAIDPSAIFPTSLLSSMKGDSCDANITCIYDEFISGQPGGIPEGSVFWFQKRMKPLFYLTASAINTTTMLRSISSGSKGFADWKPARENLVSSLYEEGKLIPVFVSVHDETGMIEGNLKYMPREVIFTIKYYNEKMAMGGSRKVIVSAAVTVGNFEELVTEDECDAKCLFYRRRYYLNFRMQEMNFYEMIEMFGLSAIAYISIAIFLATLVFLIICCTWSSVGPKRKEGPMTAVSILKKMKKDKLDEFGQVIKVATKSKKGKGDEEASDKDVEYFLRRRLGLFYEKDTFRSLRTRLKAGSRADKMIRHLDRKFHRVWNVYSMRFLKPFLAALGGLLFFYFVTVGWTFTLYHKHALGGIFTDLVPTNPALIRNIYELTLPRCIDRRDRGEQIDAGNNCLTEFFINLNRGIRVGFILWFVGGMAGMISSYMFVYHMPPVVKPKKVVGKKTKKEEIVVDRTEIEKETAWKWFHYYVFLFTSQYVCLGAIDVSSNPIFKESLYYFYAVLIVMKVGRAFFLESLLGMIAEDELQASGLRATYITTEYMMTITTGNSFVHFCIATHCLLLYEYLSIWKDSLLKERLDGMFQTRIISREDLREDGQETKRRKSYDVPLPDSTKQTKVLKLLIRVSVLLCSYIAYCLILLILWIFSNEYSRFTVRWQHLAVVFANVPFLPFIAYYLIDIEEKHADYGTYALLDLWANVARGDVLGRYNWVNTIARGVTPALLEERYNPKEKIPEKHVLELSSCIFVPIAQAPNLNLEEKYRETEKLGFTMRYFLGIFFQCFGTLLMTINMSGNMISWPTVDMVGYIFAIVSLLIIRYIFKVIVPQAMVSLKLTISHKRFVEKKISKYAASEEDKTAMRKKAVQSIVERLYYFRSIGKPDSQLVKMLRSRTRDFIGDQIQREDEMNRIVREEKERKENAKMKELMAEANQKLLDQQFSQPCDWPTELSHDKFLGQEVC